ncbi:helix-turn-helix transcriptional regulator [Paenibacillus thermotolerans]|uniref:helix-turn-helix transcriptional regulator n=1 Tax=Paenibacillus thermotolerans TaxID=3027807 RepID=UPI002368EE35|nr:MULTISPECIES: response regulator transcription factor [unclassified Paenibacillus]
MMLPAEIMPLFEGAFPSCIVTGSAEGIPNIANLSRVWRLETNRVAVANQLLNKTYINLMENPTALLKIMNPKDLIQWEISVRYERSENEGADFEKVKQDLLTLSWVAGVELSAPVRSILIFEIVSIRQCVEESFHLQPAPEAYGDLLKVLAQSHEWGRLSYWIPSEDEDGVRLQASRGVPGAGVNETAFDTMERLAKLVRKERRIIRLHNVRSQFRYLHSIRSNEGDDRNAVHIQEGSPASYLAFPVFAFGAAAGIVCCEDPGEKLSSLDERYITILSENLGDALQAAPAVEEKDREALFRQSVERARLVWEKKSDPFYTSLSARERQVAVNVAKGYTNAEIAKQLFISPRTVTTHLERIYQKLNVPSRAALTRYAMEMGLLSEETGRNE